MPLQVKGIRCAPCVFADALRRVCLILSSAAKVEAGSGGRETKNEDRNSIKLDGWHVLFHLQEWQMPLHSSRYHPNVIYEKFHSSMLNLSIVHTRLLYCWAVGLTML